MLVPLSRPVSPNLDILSQQLILMKIIVKQINAGEPPIHEPGLDSLIATHGGNRLTATKSYDIVPETAVTILALPTPPTSDGSIDLSYMETGAEAVGTALDRVNNEHQHVIVTKSTVVPTTTEEKLVPAIESAAISRGLTFVAAIPSSNGKDQPYRIFSIQISSYSGQQIQ